MMIRIQSLPYCFTLALAVCWLATSATEQTFAAGPSNAPKVGEKVPDFDLPVVGQEDSFLQLSDEYDQGIVVVIVLRGYPNYQCVNCSRQLSTLRNRARVLGEHVHRVVLVYPGEGSTLKQNAKRFVGSRKLPESFVVVRDQDMQMVDDWGLRWNKRSETAYPATFIVDKNGRVRWSKISESHAGRSTAEEILKEVRRLSKS